MAKPKVFIFAPINRGGGNENAYDVLKDAGYDLLFGSASWHTPHGNNEDQMCELAKGCDALTGGSIKSSPITGKVMDASPNLRMVAKCSIGVDDVDLEAATERGIVVTHAPTETNWSGVAESTMAVMLTLLKKIGFKDQVVKSGQWRLPELQATALSRHRDGYPGITIGIIGLGRIGRRFADLLKPWRVRVLVCDPYIDLSHIILADAERVDLDTLLKQSDVVSLHVVLTKETNQMLGESEFCMMKKGSYFINTARGPCVNTKALVKALESGHLAGAGLDVFEDEPLSADCPLLKMGPNVLLSPHMASSNMDAGLRAGVVCANEDVMKAMNGVVPEFVYNKEAIPAWIKRFRGKKV